MTVYGSQTSWMSRVSDSVLLSELTLPGTHDTMAWRYSSPDFDGTRKDSGSATKTVIDGLQFRYCNDGRYLVDIRRAGLRCPEPPMGIKRSR